MNKNILLLVLIGFSLTASADLDWGGSTSTARVELEADLNYKKIIPYEANQKMDRALCEVRKKNGRVFEFAEISLVQVERLPTGGTSTTWVNFGNWLPGACQSRDSFGCPYDREGYWRQYLPVSCQDYQSKPDPREKIEAHRSVEYFESKRAYQFTDILTKTYVCVETIQRENGDILRRDVFAEATPEQNDLTLEGFKDKCFWK